MNDQVDTNTVDENELIAQRKEKLNALRKAGQAYPNDFRRDALAGELHAVHDNKDNDTLQASKIVVSVAGRIMLRRVMGKASFVQIQDMSGCIQIYLRQNDLPEGVYDAFKTWDLGDIIGVKGFLFKTKTGELSIHAEEARLLTKALRPLPDKFHGLTDKEICYRQRYVDLIANEETRNMVYVRNHIIEFIRQFLRDRKFLEVETPMMQVIPGGAAAKPFVTHHNALDRTLYLRIAPELYLKRLVVGGFERVFEINRNFRNEGISIQHNPEFTMLEFYQSYANYNDLMDLTETLLREMSYAIYGQTQVMYQGNEIDFGKSFAKMTLKDSILHFNPDIHAADLENLASAKKIAKKLGATLFDTDGLGRVQTVIFEHTVEKNLMSPTFITEYPTEVSPLSRPNDDNPFVTDRFEFFIACREIGNGFSELNDPEEQAKRFKAQAQVRNAGDDEAMYYDEDYITALEYGMPPTAGEGIGIDRLVMLFTDAASIRDVILFPHMRDNS
ncbi:MAG: lysine--tRNA ligase [Gammaproteobacteria bacterium RIFCSPHIGHO2_02_FULL_42_13]|nr:MAG: lysine--tRNA ligase [Gammaproteobacteria bacterium RIFCSPHIGHO2_02_FULL_42_13]OGT68835.1 MAG: lysine--tRNA ligase [Gammaproteobacteria bacterium RIFCSPLOWO2_02_FULL_42_9]